MLTSPLLAVTSWLLSVITGGDDVTAYSVGAAYTYPLSKRTNLYLTGAYNNREVEGTDGWKLEQDEYKVTTGIVHKF